MSDVLPTFETVRAQAYPQLGDAQEWLATDTQDQPTGNRGEALRRARRLIAQAKDALNQAAGP